MFLSLFVFPEVVDLALLGRKRGVGIPGLVDRMILLAARHSEAQLWTLDRKLKKLFLLGI